jgi:DNA-binding transcriptional MerR regulator/methylmalonyl-CoA mutase cobalamin-binding subunit
MYTIKQAASRAGVSVPVLRQWERRYGVVSPVRTASGYRTYDEPAIARVRAMRQLIDSGWAPNAAAASIVDLDDAAVQALLARRPSTSPDDDRASVASGDLVEAFERAAASLDPAALELVLDEMFGRGAFEQVAERYLLPALRRIGAAWQAGTVDVAAEHAASHAVLRRLAVAFQASGWPSRERGLVLVGLPPGARHDLGALVFSIAARRAGLPVMHLGADLPVADWLDAAIQTDASAVVVGVVSRADVAGAEAVVEALRAARPLMPIALGGSAAGQITTPGVLVLPDGVTDAVEMVRAAARPQGLPHDGRGA